MAKYRRPAMMQTGRLTADWWLTCGACGKGEYFDARTTQRIQAAKLARKAGWRELSIENDLGGWICPDCMAKAATPPAPAEDGAA
jgi:hypothetical protein